MITSIDLSGIICRLLSNFSTSREHIESCLRVLCVVLIDHSPPSISEPLFRTNPYYSGLSKCSVVSARLCACRTLRNVDNISQGYESSNIQPLGSYVLGAQMISPTSSPYLQARSRTRTFCESAACSASTSGIDSVFSAFSREFT